MTRSPTSKANQATEMSSGRKRLNRELKDMAFESPGKNNKHVGKFSPSHASDDDDDDDSPSKKKAKADLTGGKKGNPGPGGRGGGRGNKKQQKGRAPSPTSFQPRRSGRVSGGRGGATSEDAFEVDDEEDTIGEGREDFEERQDKEISELTEQDAGPGPDLGRPFVIDGALPVGANIKPLLDDFVQSNWNTVFQIKNLRNVSVLIQLYGNVAPGGKLHQKVTLDLLRRAKKEGLIALVDIDTITLPQISEFHVLPIPGGIIIPERRKLYDQAVTALMKRSSDGRGMRGGWKTWRDEVYDFFTGGADIGDRWAANVLMIEALGGPHALALDCDEKPRRQQQGHLS